MLISEELLHRQKITQKFSKVTQESYAIHSIYTLLSILLLDRRCAIYLCVEYQLSFLFLG